MINRSIISGTTLLAALLFVAGCGGGESTGATAGQRPKSVPPLYHQKEYDAETGWTLETSDKKIGDYLETAWHDPASVPSKLIIDSRPAAGAPPPMAAAELSRAQANWLPHYRARSLKRVKIEGRPMIRWAYFAAGQDRIEYFFEECATSIMFRGSTAPVSFEPFSNYYKDIVSHVKALCPE